MIRASEGFVRVQTHGAQAAVVQSDDNLSYTDIELPQNPLRAPRQENTMLRQRALTNDFMMDVEAQSSVNSVADLSHPASSFQRPQSQDMTRSQALGKAIREVYQPKTCVMTLVTGELLGELVSGIAHTIKTGCQNNHRVVNMSSGKRICTISGEVIKEAAKNPSTHLWALMGVGGAVMLLMLMATPKIIRRAEHHLKEQASRSLKALNLKGVSLEECNEIKQKILERQTEESNQSLFDWESIDELIESNCSIVFIEQQDKFHFCKAENLKDWLQIKSGEAINPMTNLAYDDAKFFLYQPNNH